MDYLITFMMFFKKKLIKIKKRKSTITGIVRIREIDKFERWQLPNHPEPVKFKAD